MTHRASVATALAGLLLTVRTALGITCPTGGADVTVYVTNKDTAQRTVNLSGALVQGMGGCTGGGTSTSYTNVACVVNAGTTKKCTDTTPIPNKNSGIWRHWISYAAGGSGPTVSQYQRGALVADAAIDANRLDWTYYPHVLTVDTTGDSDPSPACNINGAGTGHCTFRKAVETQNGLLSDVRPALLLFSVSPGSLNDSVQIQLHSNVTIDGTDSNGNPWIVGDPNAAAQNQQSPFPRSISFPADKKIIIAAGNVELRGLEIKHASVSQVPLIERGTFGSGAGYSGFAAINSRLDGGTTSLDETVCTNNALVKFADRTGPATLYDVTLKNVEARNTCNRALDLGKPISASVQTSWLHNTYFGSINGADLNQLDMNYNFIETAGLRTGNGLKVASNAHGVNVANATLQGTIKGGGNVIRNNTGTGLTIQGFTQLTPDRDAVCGNDNTGLITSAASGKVPGIGTLGGVAMTYNAQKGAQVVAAPAPTPASAVKMGPESTYVSNASCGLYNSASTTLDAQLNQWRPIAPPFEDVCPSPSGPIDTTGYTTDRQASQPILQGYQAPVPSNSSVFGQTVRVFGTRFDAVDGNPKYNDPHFLTCKLGVDVVAGLAESCCRKAAHSNQCQGEHSPSSTIGQHCVEVSNAATTPFWYQLPARALTPRFVETEGGRFICVGNGSDTFGWKEKIRVTKRVTGGGALFGERNYCTSEATL